MDFREREEKFREADRRYAELKRQLDAGSISEEEFETERQRLMVLREGHWWAKSRETGEWHYHDGRAWVRGTPSGYQPLPTDEASDHRSRHEQTGSFSSGSQARDEPSPLSQPERDEQPPSRTTSPGSKPTRDRNERMAQTRAAPVLPPPPAARGAYYVRRRRPWLPILLLILLLLALLGGITYALTRATNEVPVPPNAGENVEEAEPGIPLPPAEKQQAPPAEKQQAPPETPPQQQKEEAEPGAPPAEKQQAPPEASPQQQQKEQQPQQ